MIRKFYLEEMKGKRDSLYSLIKEDEDSIPHFSRYQPSSIFSEIRSELQISSYLFLN